MSVTIYGRSDDLIEVEGDIREEFNVSDKPHLLGFSDGTLLKVQYTHEGIWRITLIERGSAGYNKTEATDINKNYSDRVILEGRIRWVVCGLS